MVKKTNKKNKEKVRIDIKHPGSLKKFGFHLHESIKKQKAALRKADRADGRAKVDEKLSALEVLDKHRKNIEGRLKKILKWNEDK
jgi:hypothetical protein